MAEPTTTGGISLTVIFVSLLGPWFGPYALIVFAALAGSLWPLSAQDTTTRMDGAMLVLRCMLLSVCLTSFIAYLLSKFADMPVNESLAPVALLVAAMGNGWRPVFEAVGAAIRVAAGKSTGGGVCDHDSIHLYRIE